MSICFYCWKRSDTTTGTRSQTPSNCGKHHFSDSRCACLEPIRIVSEICVNSINDRFSKGVHGQLFFSRAVLQRSRRLQWHVDPPLDPRTPTLGTSRPNRLPGGDLRNPLPGDLWSIEDCELGSIVLEPTAVAQLPDCDQIAICIKIRRSRYCQAEKYHVSPCPSLCKYQDWGYLSPLMRVAVRMVEHVFQQQIAVSRSVMQFVTKLLVVPEVGEDTYLFIHFVRPVRVIQASREDHQSWPIFLSDNSKSSLIAHWQQQMQRIIR